LKYAINKFQLISEPFSENRMADGCKVMEH